ncbi:hypothetical protein SCAR479_13021 [Seiridium cardinale]|uniref:Uncharacterized protein n=1 Tax=Seiridium cardinale TaxID=138064 RepID=A0ABR2X923_9PEZI
MTEPSATTKPAATRDTGGPETTATTRNTAGEGPAINIPKPSKQNLIPAAKNQDVVDPETRALLRSMAIGGKDGGWMVDKDIQNMFTKLIVHDNAHNNTHQLDLIRRAMHISNPKPTLVRALCDYLRSRKESRVEAVHYMDNYLAKAGDDCKDGELHDLVKRQSQMPRASPKRHLGIGKWLIRNKKQDIAVQYLEDALRHTVYWGEWLDRPRALDSSLMVPDEVGVLMEIQILYENAKASLGQGM